jgi:hypothetical protein
MRGSMGVALRPQFCADRFQTNAEAVSHSLAVEVLAGAMRKFLHSPITKR